MKDLKQAFAARNVGHAGIMMFRPDDAIDFIEAARVEQIPVLGLDAFRITEKTTQPFMDHSIDLSVGAGVPDSWSVARRFIEERREMGFVFEVVI